MKENNKENNFDKYKNVFDINSLKIIINDTTLDSYRLKDFNLVYEVNTHSKLNISFTDNGNKQLLYKALQRENPRIISIIVTDKDDIDRIVFKGNINDFNVGSHNLSEHLIKIEAVSLSSNLDQVSKFRIFQDTSLSYYDLFTLISNEHSLKFVINKEAEGALISKPIIQCDETDWEFIIRMASNLGLGVYATANGFIFIGFNIKSDQEKNIDVMRNLWESKTNKYNDIIYTLESPNSILNGDEVILWVDETTHITLYSHKGHLYFDRGILRSSVEMVLDKYYYEYIPNNKIVGKVIEGTVIDLIAQNGIAMMTLNLTAGLKKISEITYGKKSKKRTPYPDNGKKFNFPYLTPYSQTNTGLFCSPEAGDVVALYFPSNEEISGYVMGAVNNKGSQRFNVPTVRNYTTKDSKENQLFNLLLVNDSLSIKTGNTELSNKIKLTLSGTELLEVLSDKNIEIASKENLDIFAEKKLKETYELKSEQGGENILKGDKITIDYSKHITKGKIQSN